MARFQPSFSNQQHCQDKKNSSRNIMGELAVCGPAFHLAQFDRGVTVT